MKINLFEPTFKYEPQIDELLPQYSKVDLSPRQINRKLEKIKDTRIGMIIDADIKCLLHGQGRNTSTLDNACKSSSSITSQRNRCTHSHVKKNSIGRIEEASKLLFSKDPHPSKLINKKKLLFTNAKTSEKYDTN